MSRRLKVSSAQLGPINVADSRASVVKRMVEMLKEADHQFLPDGGNYECSTNYHRLSGEIVVFALGVIASLDAPVLKRLDRATPPARAWRAEFPALPLPRHGEVSSGAVPASLHRLWTPRRMSAMRWFSRRSR